MLEVELVIKLMASVDGAVDIDVVAFAGVFMTVAPDDDDEIEDGGDVIIALSGNIVLDDVTLSVQLILVTDTFDRPKPLMLGEEVNEPELPPPDADIFPIFFHSAFQSKSNFFLGEVITMKNSSSERKRETFISSDINIEIAQNRLFPSKKNTKTHTLRVCFYTDND